MGEQGDAHRVSIGFPPTSRTLDVGEQERHNARRRSPRGHSHRIPQGTLVHAVNRGDGGDPVADQTICTPAKPTHDLSAAGIADMPVSERRVEDLR
jgi:hypothetical protein